MSAALVLPITSGSVVVSPKPWMESEPREVRAEARLRAGHAEVRHQREPEPAANRRPVDRADDRFPEPEQTDRLYIKVSDRLRLLAGPLPRAVERAAIAEIRARAKRLALGCQHDGAATGILVERLERAGDLADHRDIEEIVGRPPDLDEADEPRCLDADVLERTHLIFLSLCLTRASRVRGRCGNPPSAAWRGRNGARR